MKYLFWLWFVPMALFWSWFGLSYYDMNFGTMALSRQVHDMVFGIYANILGVSQETIVSGFVKACIFDTFLIFGIIAFRKRKQIKAWWNARKGGAQEADQTLEPAQSDIVPAE